MSFGLWLLILSRVKSAGSLPPPGGKTVNARVFLARNLVKELSPDGNTVIITRKTISHYLAAATMLFEAKDFKDLGGLPRGDEIAFRPYVANTGRRRYPITAIGETGVQSARFPTDCPFAAIF